MTKKYDKYVEKNGKTFNLECIAYSINELTKENDEIPYAINRNLVADPEHIGALVITCIQASTFFNKNDHFFIPEELWKAKNTSKFMIADWEHDRKQIIGCISDSFAVGKDGNILPEDTKVDNSFEFDVGNEIVVWSRLFEEYAENIRTMYENGELFVSMECAFNDFDFAIEDPIAKKISLVERNEQTDFLTDYLIHFGGPGKYQNHRVGIAFRDFSFVGTGFCKKPANPRSHVLDVAGTENLIEAVAIEEIIEKNTILEKNIKESEKSGVIKYDKTNYEEFSSEKGEKDMDFEKEYKETLAKLEGLQAKTNQEKEDSAKKIGELETKVTDLEGKVSEASDEKDNVLKEVSEKEAKIGNLEKEKEDLIAKLTEVESKLAQIEKARENEGRKAAIAELNVEISDEELFAMSKEQFDILVKYAAKKETKVEATEETEKETEEKETEKATEEVASATEEKETDEVDEAEATKKEKTALHSFIKIMDRK